MTIKAHYDNPPIPIRAFDWSAWDDDTADEGMIIGRGPTEHAAKADLLTSLKIVHCPRCLSERIAERIAFNTEPHGEAGEQVYYECLEPNCQEKFEEDVREVVTEKEKAAASKGFANWLAGVFVNPFTEPEVRYGSERVWEAWEDGATAARELFKKWREREEQQIGRRGLKK